MDRRAGGVHRHLGLRRPGGAGNHSPDKGTFAGGEDPLRIVQHLLRIAAAGQHQRHLSGHGALLRAGRSDPGRQLRQGAHGASRPPKRFWERTNTVSTISTPCGTSERRRKRGKARFLSLPTLRGDRGDKGEGPGRMRWKRTAEKTGRFPSCHRETMEKIAG